MAGLDGWGRAGDRPAGIGKEVTLALAGAGAEAVVFADVNERGAQEAAKESKKFAKHPKYRPMPLHVDITSEASVQNMVNSTIKHFGRIDYNVNSAELGNLSGAMTPNVKVDAFAKTIETNITKTMLCLRAVTRAMAEQDPLTHHGRHGRRSLGRGCVVNLGSVNSYVPAPGMLPYTTSKHAIIGLTKSATMDNLGSHVRINAVCLSWVDTPMTSRSLERAPQLGKLIQNVSPLQRVASVDEVADYIVFLCGLSASYINGTSLIIDAGATLTAHID